MTSLAHRFADALQTLESERDPAPLVDLFAPDAEVSNASTRHGHSGRDGAQEFWTSYRDTFDDIRSEFSVIVEDEQGAALEWNATGKLAGGTPIDYSGVSLIEVADGKVQRFTAYFDPSALVDV